MTPEKREETAKEFVNETLGLIWNELDENAQTRAKRMMSKDFSHSPSKDGKSGRRYSTTFSEVFSTFCDSDEMAKGWKDCSRLFFDENAIEKYLVVRNQRSGTCCLHAAVVFQHYLQSLRHIRDEEESSCARKMLDISDFLRNYLSREKQIKYIKTGAWGLGSEFFFLMITELQRYHLTRFYFWRKSESEFQFHGQLDCLLHHYETRKAPALVSCFSVEEDFHGKQIHQGEVKEEKFLDYANTRGKPGGCHVLRSMVMLGVHKDEKSGTVWFLLQNFWHKDYFRLVSAEYLASCSPTICFLSNKSSIDVSLKNNPPMVDGEYAETDVQVEECYVYPEEE